MVFGSANDLFLYRTHPIHTRWSYAGTPSCSHTRMVWAVPLVGLVEMW